MNNGICVRQRDEAAWMVCDALVPFTERQNQGMTIGKFKVPALMVIFFISLLGFFIGVLTISLWQENLLLQNNIMEQEFWETISCLSVDKRALFFLCLEKRLGAFFLLFLLSFSSMNLIVVLFYFGYSGFAIGSIVELLVIRYGVKGLLLYLTFVFPQGLFYCLGTLILGCWCLNSEIKVKGNRNRKVEKMKYGKNKKQLFVTILLILFGAYLESNINKKFFLMFFDV